ncbi:hypothetical protein LO772_21455 [Yinghuangia sp. ASG 101]|uniref:hypothetical protein n=1 Tax=Yinghuangia sp. ASG 101 TaxID=2896848 RepID=UPI001E5DD610|nr:hypothetical protein [Yinghuangia sp. ASG 101]UGQ09502.1 hypothetical protein LO772_21455 [Yinghuangia sp. ASG 101]
MARRKAARYALGLAATVAACLAGPLPQAAAGTPVAMRVTCELPLGQGTHTGEQVVTLDAPAEPVRPGDKVRIRVTLGPSFATSPIALPGTPLTPSIEVVLSGGATGTVRLFGPQTLVDIPGHPDPIVVPPYEGELTVPIEARGDIALAPGRMVTNTTVLGVQTTTCTPDAPAAVSTVVAVAADAPLTAPEGQAAPPADPRAPRTAVPAPPPVTEAPLLGTATATAEPTGPEPSSATLKAENRSSSDGDDGMSGATVFGIAAGALVLLMAVVTMLMSWRRHTDDD